MSMVKSIPAEGIQIHGFTVRQSINSSAVFTAQRGDYPNTLTIGFIAKLKNGGLYSKCSNYSQNQRHYRAQRYTVKYTRLVCDIAFELLKGGYLWDYDRQCPALDGWNK